jgi:Sec-independent protein secretion pathway component TatC
MALSRRVQALIYESLLIMLGFAVAAQVSPPDPFTQVLAALVILVVTLPVSYWLAYKRH